MANNHVKALSGELERICQRILLKRYFWQINEKVFPDKFADKEMLNESEVIYYINFAEKWTFCKKEGIYDVNYNWRFYHGKEFIFYLFPRTNSNASITPNIPIQHKQL